MGFSVDTTKEYKASGILIIIAAIILAVIGEGVALIMRIPVSIHNKNICNGPVPINSVLYSAYIKTNSLGVILPESKIPENMADSYFESVKECCEDSNLNYRRVRSNSNIEYGCKSIIITENPVIIFKYFGEKNLVQFNYTAKIDFYTDATKTTTFPLEFNIYYIGFGLSLSDTTLKESDGHICFYSEKSYTDGYSDFQKEFKQTVYLNGHIFASDNQYDSYTEIPNFFSQEIDYNKEGYINEIFKQSFQDGEIIRSFVRSVALQKCRNINYGKTNRQILFLNPIYIKNQQYSGDFLYEGKGNIKAGNKKFSFDKNLYICKFAVDSGFQIVIMTDVEIKDGKIFGKAVIFSNKDKISNEKMTEILNNINEYAEQNLTLVFAN